MWKEDTFNNVIDQLLDGHLGKAMNLIENYLLAHPGHPSSEQFRLYASHYDLLANYWRSGYDDPARDQLYTQLLHRVYSLVLGMIQHESNLHSSFRASLHRAALQYRKDWSMTAVQAALENFVSSVALLSLEAEEVRQEKSMALHQEHQKLLSHLFNYIWTSEPWHRADAETCLGMLLSPTIDSRDQQLIVSSIMLAAMNLFDIHKFTTLAKVYQQATDERVRQRALVGWALVADADKARLYPEVQEMVTQLCEDEHCCQELVELQMQMIYCMDAEADTRRIQDEIMPDLLKNSHVKITRDGIVDAEEDSLEDILHPDAAEQNMEKMEESIKKMADMQKQGSDIYFGGFSQMKRFPFFSDVSNWLVPFYPQHPGVSKIWNQGRGRKFLHIITKLGAFCDSDKYSFVLAFEMVLDRIPASMLSMIDKGEAVPMPVGGEIAVDAQREPAFIRRVYLQNLYRFFKLYSMRSEFRNPFGERESLDFLFFCNPLLVNTPLQGHFVQMASFLIKRKMNTAAFRILEQCSRDERGFQYYMMMGSLVQRQGVLGHGEATSASMFFQQAVELRPDNEKALAGLARARFNEQDYQQAQDAYDRLLLLRPGHVSYELGRAVCLLSLKQYGEALQKLFQLDYEQPGNMAVRRSLAWALTVNDKYEQAERLYHELTNEETAQSTDLLNYGYCLWFQRKHQQAALMFRRLGHASSPFNYDKEFTKVEAELIKEKGITNVEVQLMLDLISNE